MASPGDELWKKRWFVPVVAAGLAGLLLVAALGDFLLPVVVVGNIAFVGTLAWMFLAEVQRAQARRRGGGAPARPDAPPREGAAASGPPADASATPSDAQAPAEPATPSPADDSQQTPHA